MPPPDVVPHAYIASKFDVCWGFAQIDPTGGAHSAPPDHLAAFNGREGRGGKGEEGRGRKERGRKG